MKNVVIYLVCELRIRRIFIDSNYRLSDAETSQRIEKIQKFLIGCYIRHRRRSLTLVIKSHLIQ